MTDPKLEEQLRTYASLESLHQKVDAQMALAKQNANTLLHLDAKVTKLEDRYEHLEARVARHGRKLRDYERSLQPMRQQMPTNPNGFHPQAMVPPAMSEDQLSDSGSWTIPAEDVHRVRELVAQAKADSEWRRLAPRQFAVWIGGVVGAATLAAIVTWLATHGGR